MVHQHYLMVEFPNIGNSNLSRLGYRNTQPSTFNGKHSGTLSRHGVKGMYYVKELSKT